MIMSSTTIHTSHFHTSFFKGCPTPRSKCQRIAATCSMTMDSSFPPTMKKELSVQLSTPKVETLRFCDLHFDRSQPSDQEFDQHTTFEFGQFVARNALLDQEHWTAAWLRAENFWEDRSYERCDTQIRYMDHYRREFADRVEIEYNAIKRRCEVQHGENYSCIIAVRKERKNVNCSMLNSVVGTLDLNIRCLLQGETFPAVRVKPPPFCSINRTPSSRYCYIANLCVAKSARRQGVASNMLYFALESAKSIGVARVYVHVDRNNKPAQIMYQNMGFEMVEMANSLLLNEQMYLLRSELQT